MVIKKGLTKKFIVIGILGVLTGGMIVSVFAVHNNFNTYGVEVHNLGELEGQGSLNEFDGEIINLDYGVSISNVLSEKEVNEIKELENKLKVLNEEYFNLSVKYRDEFEELDFEMNKIFEKQFKLGIEAKQSDYNKLGKEISLVEKKYEELEKKAGVDKVNEQIMSISEEINSIYGVNSFDFTFGNNLSDEERIKLEKLYEKMDKIFEDNIDKYEKINIEYHKKLDQLDEESGVLKLRAEIDEILGQSRVETDFYRNDKELENLYERIEKIHSRNYNKFEELDRVYNLTDANELIEVVALDDIELNGITGFDLVWSGVYSYFE